MRPARIDLHGEHMGGRVGEFGRQAAASGPDLEHEIVAGQARAANQLGGEPVATKEVLVESAASSAPRGMRALLGHGRSLQSCGRSSLSRSYRDPDQPLERVGDLIRQLALRALEPGPILLVREQLERRDVTTANALERRLAADRRALAEANDTGLEAGGHKLLRELLLGGKPIPVDALERREDLVQPEAVEVRGIKGGDHDAPVRSEYA